MDKPSDPGETFFIVFGISLTVVIVGALVFSIVYYVRNPLPPSSPSSPSSLELFLPLSGSEPEYEPEKWNSDPILQKNHNCYAYVLDDLISGRENKPQPGTWSNTDNDANEAQKYSSCPVMLGRIMADNNSIYPVQETEPCRKGFYKGYLTLHPGKDYHFYRQDSNGYFSHKRGKLAVEDTDAARNKIEVPRLAVKHYGDYSYIDSCGYFCIPNNKTKQTNSI